MKPLTKANQLRLLFHRHRKLVSKIVICSLLPIVFCLPALAQSDYVSPGDNLIIEGIPQIPTSLARTIKRYTGAYGLPLVGWDAAKREVWLKNITGSSASLYRVAAPGDTAQPFSFIPEGGVYDLYPSPNSRYLVYNRDVNGNEAFQMYLYDFETRKSTLLTDGKSRNTEPVWSNKGKQIIYSSSPQGGSGVSLSVVDPFEPKTNRLLSQSTGTYFKAYDWSPDDSQAVFVDYISNTVSTLWLIDVATGKKTLLSPKTDTANEYYDSPQFSKDGRGIYVISDHDSDVLRLAYIDLATKQFQYPVAQIKWGVEDFRLALDGATLAFVTNEEGISRLHLLDTRTNQERLVTTTPTGVISNLRWHSNSQDIAFNFKSSRTPGDVYSINIQSGKVERWAKGKTGEADVSQIPEPELIRWKSFDNRTISGFLYRPPAHFMGKRPVVIEIHGGPEEQYRPNFWGEDNYLLNELGVAKIYPNVRGSSGYGKTFLDLDNGIRREDAVKDAGALLDWIKEQPGLDADRVMVTGASYGGFVALSVSTNYPDRIRAVQSISGPSNLVTFLENTEGWRRDVRRAEYGDERDTKMRAFLERIAPLDKAQKSKKPLFVVQGLNDPRVKASESERMIAAAKRNNIPAWYLLAKDEGHDFVNQKNIDFQFYATALFIQQYLLR